MSQAKKAISKTSGKVSARNAARAAVKNYHNYIDGKWIASESGEMFENINPADTRDIIGRFPLSTTLRARSISGVTRRRRNVLNSCFASARY
jgi:aldehyde dehydrogenase (NAD+)